MAKNPQQDSRRMVRGALATLRLAVEYAEHGGSPRRFLSQRLSPRDGGPWLSERHDQADPALQREVATLLRDLVERRPGIGLGEHELHVRLSLGVRRHAGRVVVTYGGSPRDLFLYRLVRLLEHVGGERLRVCHAPDRTRPEGICGRVFLKVTRKEFCSTRCQSRTLMRRKRADEKADKAAILKGGRHATRTKAQTRTTRPR